MSPTNITFDSDVFVWGILSLCQVHNALPNSLNTGDAGRANQRPQYRDAGQIKDPNTGGMQAGQIKDLTYTVGFVGSVRSSLSLCPQILAYLLMNKPNNTMVLDLVFKNPLRWDVGNIRRH